MSNTEKETVIYFQFQSLLSELLQIKFQCIVTRWRPRSEMLVTAEKKLHYSFVATSTSSEYPDYVSLVGLKTENHELHLHMKWREQGQDSQGRKSTLKDRGPNKKRLKQQRQINLNSNQMGKQLK